MPKYPDATFDLPYGDNAITILMGAERAMRRAGVSLDDIAAFRAKATDGDYEHLIATVEAHVEVT